MFSWAACCSSPSRAAKADALISTPVNYVRDSARDGDTLLITSKADRTWWKNLRGGAPVTLFMNGKTYRAQPP